MIIIEKYRQSSINSSFRNNVVLLIALVWFGASSEVLANASFQNTQDSLKLLSPEDYGKWESIGYGGAISNDGYSLVYPIQRNNDQNELRLHHLSRGTIRIIANGGNPKFSNDNTYLGYLVSPSPAERKKLTKAKKPIHKDFGLININTEDSVSIEKVSAFEFSGDGQFVTIKRYKGAGSKTKGVDLVVRNLKTGKHFSFGNVVEYTWTENGALMAFIVETEGEFGNGVQLFDGKTETIRLLDSEEASYSGLRWRAKSDDLVVYRSVKNEDYEELSQMVLAWKGLADGTADAFLFDPSAATGFGADKKIASNKPLRWSEDGNAIFFETDEWIRKSPKPDASVVTDSTAESQHNHLFEEAPGLEIWHSKDVRIIPEQKQLAARNRASTDLAVWHLKDNRFVQLGDELTEETIFENHSAIILGIDATPYEFDGMFGRFNADIYAINIEDGAKKKLLEKINRVYDISPDGKFMLYLKNNNYYLYNFQSSESKNLTGGLKASFVNLEDDHPTPQKPTYGFAGWLKSSTSFLAHSKYDVWQIYTDGRPANNLTNGVSDKITSRYIRVDYNENYIDSGDPVYIKRTGEWTKKSGYSLLSPEGEFKTLHWGDVAVGRFAKAKNADVVVYVAEAYDDSPDYFLNANGAAESRQISKTNPFQKDYYWGKTELIDYKNHKGRKLQGILMYPDNYDPEKKYPMITYIYELRSQAIHRYIVPSQRNYYNFKVFTSQGYFVLQPDIVFDAGDPGVSSVKTMELAVKSVVDKGLVDKDRVGLVGHSWGGYQSAFAVTETDIFAAAVAGAGLTNLVSMYGMVAWAFGGSPESYHFEVSQERMMVPPWKDIEGYTRNSPVFNVDKMNTPLLFEVGDNDKNVDWRQGIEMYNAARRAGKQMVMLVYANEGHGLRQDKNRIDYHNRILEWFGHYLKDQPADEWILGGVRYEAQQKQLKDWKKE